MPSATRKRGRKSEPVVQALPLPTLTATARRTASSAISACKECGSVVKTIAKTDTAILVDLEHCLAALKDAARDGDVAAARHAVVCAKRAGSIPWASGKMKM